MKRIAVLIFVGTLLLGTAVAQTSVASQSNASASQSTSVSADRSSAQADSRNSANAAQSANVSNKSAHAAAASQLKSGSSIHATLEKPVDARKNKPGDQVVAKTNEDVMSEGKVVIPRGSKIVGHVTEVKARGKGQAESAVSVVFDPAVLKDGREAPLSLVAQGVGGGGLVGGVRSASGSLVNTAGSVGGATVITATGASSSLNSTSQGVVGIRGLSLASSASSATSGTFTSRDSNVHLDSGTQMILSVQK